MKRIFLLLMVAISAIIIGCNNDEPDDELAIVLKTTAIDFPAEGGSQVVEFVASGEWSVQSNVHWCKVSPTSGEAGSASITVTLEKHPEDKYSNAEQRSCSIVISSGTATRTITATQECFIYSSEEREALVDLYKAMNGDSWSTSFKRNWCTDKPISTWEGVECLGGHVVGLALKFRYEGSIPESFGKLTKLEKLDFGVGTLNGPIPESVMKTSWWPLLWHEFVTHRGEGMLEEDLVIPAPTFSCQDVNGRTIDDSIFGQNEYTVLMCDIVGGSTLYDRNELNQLYQNFRDGGIELITNVCGATPNQSKNYYIKYQTPWKVLLTTIDNPYFAPYNEASWPHWVSIFDKNGKMVFNPYYHSIEDLLDFLYTNVGFGYESTDYSQDGVVTTLQTATKGNGIDLVLMGDAFTDKHIANGTYDRVTKTAMEHFFSVEPYKSYRDHFNVYLVKAVSQHGLYATGATTAFSCWFGEGTHVAGDHSKVIKYGLKAISDERMDKAMLVVIMNSPTHAGTCHMYYPPDKGDYGCGLSISYFPIGVDDTAMGRVLNHEANGHGFAKLADEYFYEANGIIPSEKVTATQRQQANLGWWENVDFTSDITAVRWAKFISDTRYANEKLGAYEGGMTYLSGIWRPTELSIMRYNTGGFNAPSREAIYYRINKLAYGADWVYDYETFVEYDEINRTVTTTTQSAPMIYKPTTPPVVMNKSWRDELR